MNLQMHYYQESLSWLSPQAISEPNRGDTAAKWAQKSHPLESESGKGYAFGITESVHCFV
jgi:hypothetical protein